MNSLMDYPLKPYTRWWWFSGPIDRSTIEHQLDWVKTSGFGGVEVAWVYSLDPLADSGPKWLDHDWQESVAFAKQCCDERGLGCDFTFGTAWPFGGSIVPPEHAAQTFFGLSGQRLLGSWEERDAGQGLILDHLSREALEHYARAMGGALKQALEGRTSALFCDSWEVDTTDLWSRGLWEAFEQRFGYSLQEFHHRLNSHRHVRYDYRKFLAEVVIEQFFRPFTEICHDLGARSRVQCHGAPTDLLEAYSVVDIPETEVLLFPTWFARIAASAAAFASKPVVSCEMFTCMYGFPAAHQGREHLADLKLLADAAIAQGVNHIVWHGMPYNPPGGSNRFFASVHVGPESPLADRLADFNEYLTTLCRWMRLGKPYTNLAVYLPLETNWMLDALPETLRTPGAHHHWELRYVVPPPECQGHHPLWISLPFLRKAEVNQMAMAVGDVRFEGLYVDTAWLDAAALDEILRLATAGLPVVMRQRPLQPGHIEDPEFSGKLAELLGLDNVVDSINNVRLASLVEGEDIPSYWARDLSESLLILFANPAARGIAYPMQLGQARGEETQQRPLTVNAFGRRVELSLEFQPCQSILLRIDARGNVRPIDIRFALPPE